MPAEVLNLFMLCLPEHILSPLLTEKSQYEDKSIQGLDKQKQ